MPTCYPPKQQNVLCLLLKCVLHRPPSLLYGSFVSICQCANYLNDSYYLSNLFVVVEQVGVWVCLCTHAWACVCVEVCHIVVLYLGWGLRCTEYLRLYVDNPLKFLHAKNKVVNVCVCLCVGVFPLCVCAHVDTLNCHVSCVGEVACRRSRSRFISRVCPGGPHKAMLIFLLFISMCSRPEGRETDRVLGSLPTPPLLELLHFLTFTQSILMIKTCHCRTEENPSVRHTIEKSALSLSVSLWEYLTFI